MDKQVTISKAQAETLERVSDGEVHRANQLVNRVAVFNRRTLNSLAKHGLIQFSNTILFQITEAGREALERYTAAEEVTA